MARTIWMIVPVVALSLAPLACVVHEEAGPPRAAGEGSQPRMHEALAQLSKARAALEQASANKGGHREKAIALVDQATNEINTGIAYADQHPGGSPSPVNAPAPAPINAANQPHMQEADNALRAARGSLEQGSDDKGGHRVRAIEIIDQAIGEVQQGAVFADQHH